MSEHKIIAVLYAHYNPTLKGLEFKLTDNQYWIGDTDVIVNKEFEVTVQVADLDQETFTRLAINTLRDKQTKAWADAQKSVTELEEKIKELQLLTWQSDVLKEGDFQLKPEGSTAELYEEPFIVDDLSAADERIVLSGLFTKSADLDVIQQTELDIAEGGWEAYSEEEKQTISDLNNFDGQGL